MTQRMQRWRWKSSCAQKDVCSYRYVDQQFITTTLFDHALHFQTIAQRCGLACDGCGAAALPPPTWTGNATKESTLDSETLPAYRWYYAACIIVCIKAVALQWEESWVHRTWRTPRCLGRSLKCSVTWKLKQADHGMAKMIMWCWLSPRPLQARLAAVPEVSNKSFWTAGSLLQSFLPERFPDAPEVGSAGEMKAIMEPCITDSRVQVLELMKKYSHVKNELMQQVSAKNCFASH